MKDPAVKLAMALCVLLAGVCAAMLFRHEKRQANSTESAVSEDVLLRCRADEPRGSARMKKGGVAPAASLSGQRPPTVVVPLDRRETPPSLAADYPEPTRSASSRWGVSMDMLLPDEQSPRTHRIVDGDTLPGLAQRYLGSMGRGQEIFEINRDVLHDPELLPIGVELKLPPRDSRSTAAAPSAVVAPPQSLVPVR